MAAPSETPQEMMGVLDSLLEDSQTPEEFHKMILERLMPQVTKEDARRILYGRKKESNG